MTKRDITTLTFIVLGISIVAGMLVQLSNNLMLKPPDSYSSNDLLGILIIMLVLILFGGVLILKSGYISKIIFKDDNNSKIEFSLDKHETIQVSIVILCLYFLVSLFPSLIDSITGLISIFTDERSYFYQFIPKHISLIVLYLLILMSLFKSSKVSALIGKKIK